MGLGKMIDFLRSKQIYGSFTVCGISFIVVPEVLVPAEEAPETPPKSEEALEKGRKIMSDGLTAAQQEELYGRVLG